MTYDPQRAQAVFLAALEISDSAARRELLERECIGDDALRRRVDELLGAHEATRGFDDESFESNFVRAAANVPVAVTGQGTILSERYKLIEAIGEGGMGSVWLAEQKEPVKRKVAVKLIKAGMDSRAVLARFEAERQALAVMDHPHIAKVLDGGTTTQGHPYFVMELVKGIPLTDYCDQVQMAVSQRLELFNQVCSAVQHAHQKGIIHRDLKPSNILVTEYDGKPMCKVIDFGLAKAIQGAHTLTDVSMHTAFGAVVGTPLYMAPEQLGVNALDIDTRADLYALGVILYELLTGSTPIEKQRLKKAALDEIMRIVREEEPAIPSQRLSSSETLPNVAARRHIEPARLTKLVRGDLDWIVMKTLEKDRNRRYETANGLSLDIQRYLAGEAVLAAPPSGIYRLRKFVRKHRGPVIAASLLALSLIGGIIGTSVGFYNARLSAIAERGAKLDAQNKQAEAERARGEAETERTAAELARNDAVSQKTRAEAREQEAIAAVRRFGDSVAKNPDLKNNPSLESLRKTLLQEPLAFFQSLRTRLQSDPDTTPESLRRLAVAAFDLAFLTDEIGDKQNAIKAYEHSIAISDSLTRENPKLAGFQSDLAISYSNLGVLLAATGKPAEALQAYEQALEIQKRLANDYPSVTEFQSYLADSLNNLGQLLSKTGKPTEALTAYEQALEIEKRLASEHPTVTEFQNDLAASHNTLGLLLTETGKPTDALTAYEQALEIQKRLANDYPSVTEFQSNLADSLNNLGILLTETGKPTEALTAYEQALEIKKRLASQNSTVTAFQIALANSHYNMGSLLSATGKPTDAIQAYQQALEIQKRLASDFPTMSELQSGVSATLNNLAVLDLDSRRFLEARERIREAVEFQKRALATNVNHPTYRQSLKKRYMNLLNVIGRTTDTDLDPATRNAEIDETAIALQELLSPAEYGAAFFQLSDVLFSAGEPDGAERYLRRGLEVRTQAVALSEPDDKDAAWLLALYWMDGGNLLQKNNRVPDSIEWYTQATEVLLPYHERWPRSDVTHQLRWAYQNRGWSQVLSGKYADAINDYDQALKYCPAPDQLNLRAMRASARLRSGATAEAFAEIDALKAEFQGTYQQAYDLACFYAVASTLVPEQQQAYAEQAMQYLQQAVAAGWKDGKHMASDIDLESLRGREDFQKLLQSLLPQPGTSP